MRHRTNFIEKSITELQLMLENDVPLRKIAMKAVELGEKAAYHHDDIYTSCVRSANCGAPYKFIVYKDGVVLFETGYEFECKDKAILAADAVVRNLR